MGRVLGHLCYLAGLKVGVPTLTPSFTQIQLGIPPRAAIHSKVDGGAGLRKPAWEVRRMSCAATLHREFRLTPASNATRAPLSAGGQHAVNEPAGVHIQRGGGRCGVVGAGGENRELPGLK